MSTWGKCDVDPDVDASRFRLERVRGGEPPRNHVALVAVAAVVFVGLLWMKPWEGAPRPALVALVPDPNAQTAQPPQPGLTPATPTTAPGVLPGAPTQPPTHERTPSPTPGEAALALKRRHCDPADAWRLVSMEENAKRRTRTLWGARIQDGTGPADVSLIGSRDYSQRLTAVGICVPFIPALPPVEHLKHVVLWHIAPGGEIREITRPVIVDVPLFDTGEAYFAPPADLGDSWPAGRYVFEIRRIAGGGSRFMALDYIPTRAAG